ncbi:hypothetical protein MGYG_02289 [Nannizzia gypsea CBS 118893]|uniref:Uncharacterized protein n=1 Tax=Arthroderma gypseum (strain ATCC MYA-4604 / CBS 118893) TaxID=535722 RepID=E4UQV0_ARTGP|nr:hypothetical protein MGYG_02289 [Nannizzia gypsea CBS 118893]EFQ99276.1 hypothetical protein MGYG_02289 [Nannizzia gypsea CBS 118893]
MKCPDGFFTDHYEVGGALATENGEGRLNTRVKESGGPKAPYIVRQIAATGYDQQIKKGVGVFLLRKPLQGNLYKDVKNLQLEMACVKAKRLSDEDIANQGGSSNTSGGGDDIIVPDLDSGSAGRPAFCASLVSAAVLIWVFSQI